MKTLSGIRFLVDERGQKTAVQLDLKRHGELWEDICENLVAAEREKEPLVPFEQVKRELTARRSRKATRN